ncbi:MAG: SGNH/GDSL hydrolase family protein, partial [Calditrichia bacterium]
TKNQLVLTKMVAVGNSLTAGYQSAGLVQEFQKHSYPYLIARQIGQADRFEQPLIAEPGISSTPGVGAMKFENGNIVPRGTYTNPMALLRNATLPRPYDNLGVPGADLNDVLNTVDGSGGNPFFDLILRNPNFANMTQIEQANLLKPTLLLLWIGNNDVLGAALDGGDASRITDPADFQTRFTELVTRAGEIRPGNIGIVIGNIPNVTDIPYVNLLDNLIYKNFGPLGTLPVVFDGSFQPVDFDTSASGELYIPLIAEESALNGSPVSHILLPFLSEYQSSGLGVPDSAALVQMLVAMGVPASIAPFQAQALEQGMIANGLTPSGQLIPGDLTITAAEESDLVQAVNAYNQIISGITAGAGIPMVDINSLLSELNTSGIDGYSGRFVFMDPANTAFSLDGVHPNNGGQALIANAFIQVLNQFPDINIPLVNTEQYKGQYTGMPGLKRLSLQAATAVKPLFTR